MRQQVRLLPGAPPGSSQPAVNVAEPATALPTLVNDYLARGLAPNTVNQVYEYPLIGVVRAGGDRGRVGD
jgi:hypothetical protein